MPAPPSALPQGLIDQVAEAVRRVRVQILWKPGKDQAHLRKRIARGHLLPGTAPAEYEEVIRSIVTHPEALVYVYQHGSVYYPTIVASSAGRTWLVMFSMDGILETAFPPNRPDTYFTDELGYHLLGRVREIVR